MPAHIAPHKGDAEDPGAEHRLCMCRLVLAGEAGLGTCALEIERGGTSYTVDTLRAIHASHPHAELTFIVGADTASTLPAWREPRELLGLAGLAVAARSGSARHAVLDAIAHVPGPPIAPAAVRFLEMPVIDISSSMVRTRARAGQPLEDLVGEAVAGYISEHGLYRSRAHGMSGSTAAGPSGAATAGADGPGAGTPQ